MSLNKHQLPTPTVKTDSNYRKAILEQTQKDLTETHASTLTEEQIKLAQEHYAKNNLTYHNYSHINTMLKLVNSKNTQFLDMRTVELAILYHDAIYEPGATDNEKQSATLMLKEMKEKYSPAQLQKAALIIENTAHHNDPQSAEEALVFYADLAILGSEWNQYLAYATSVALEWNHYLTHEQYREGRTTFLKSMLKNQVILDPNWATKEEETRARLNMQRELSALAPDSVTGFLKEYFI